MKNVGKIFENNIKKSCPDWLFVYRPPDSAVSFNLQKKSNVRFSNKSPCDFFFFDGKNGNLFAIECKTFKERCSFERDKSDKGIIHFHQIEFLLKFSQYENIISGFLLDFRNSDNTYFLHILDFLNLIKNINKKSFNEKDMLKFSNPILIDKIKLKINYRYDIEKLLLEFAK